MSTEPCLELLGVRIDTVVHELLKAAQGAPDHSFSTWAILPPGGENEFLGGGNNVFYVYI